MAILKAGVRWDLGHNTTFDVAVIGGGIIGLAAAWRVLGAGLRVAVLDARAMAGEASAAGAGMLAPGGEARHFADWAKSTVEARRLYPAFVEELRALSGVGIDFRECGAVEIASDDAAWESLTQRRAIQQQLGIMVEGIEESAARQLAPALRTGAFRALLYPNDAIVDPRSVTAALRSLLLRAGASLLEAHPVTSVIREGDGYALAAAQCGGDALQAPQRVLAGAVVLAAGAWASDIALPEPRENLFAPPRLAFPIRGHLIRAERPAGTLGPIVREEHLYVFQRQSGELISGSNEEHVGFDRTPNAAAVQEIFAKTGRLLPGLFPEDSSSASWLGFRPGIVGEGPEVRRLGGERIWLAYGHYRNGILLAPLTAATLAREIAG